MILRIICREFIARYPYTYLFFGNLIISKKSDKMITLPNLHPHFITDALGKRVSVVIPMEEYEELLEDIEDLAAIAERRDEPTLTHEDLMASLKQDGIL